MQDLEKARVLLPETVERAELVCKESGGLTGVRDGVVYALPDELVVLQQAVVGVLWKADRGQREVSMMGSASSGWPGAASRRTGRSNRTRLWPRTSVAFAASLASWSRVEARLCPRVRVSDA